MSIAEISARIAQIQQLSTSRPAAVDRFAGPSFAATLASLSPRTDTSASGLSALGGVPSPVYEGAAAAGQADGDDLAAWAARQVGVPYVAGGRSQKGWDCAGFTQWVAGQYGVSIPDVSWEQIKQGSPVADLSSARPGDLLFFHEPNGHHHDPSPLGVNHVAIYLGDGKMVEAANPHAGTRISDVDTAHLVGIRRIAPTGDGVARTPTEVAAAAATSAYSPSALSAAVPIASAGTVSSSAQLSPTQLVDVLKQAGFQGEGLRTAWAVAMRESHGRPGAVSPVNPNGTRDHGLFQLNDIHLGRNVDPSQVLDPVANAKAAYRISNGGTSWGAWGLGHSGWAGHLETAQPQFYARINAAYQAWYARFPGA
ncbi:MAG: NlpC/P60 family protein [Candidatus Nanopelagicales bacterium]